MKFLIIFICVAVTGCSSIVPYEENFACRKKDNLGKCIGMQDAYEEAITGEEQHPYIKPASEANSEDMITYAAQKKSSIQTKSSAYLSYIDAYYNELSSIVNKPVSPMIKQAKTIRTLILPYVGTSYSGSSYSGKSYTGTKKTLWMERYAYTIVEEPNFILGQYLLKKKPPLETLMTINK